MENYKNIESYLLDNEDKNVEIRKKSLIPSVVLMIIALVLIIIPATPIKFGHYACLLMVILGVIVLIFAVLKFWGDSTRHKNVYVYVPDNQMMKHYSVYVDSADMAKVNSCIAKLSFGDLASVKKRMTSGHYIDVLGTPAGNYYLIQMMDYVPHQFEAVSPVAVLTGQSAEIMSKLIREYA